MKRFLGYLLPLLILLLLPVAQPQHVSAHGTHKTPISSTYNNRIIDDPIFTNKNTMGISAIQSFLNSKVPVCRSGYTCLKDYSQGGKSAARIIYEAAQEFGINPRVILVTLQKEQSLVTDDWPVSSQYRTAMGYGCPESQSTCDAEYYGFTNQVRLGTQLMRVGVDRNCGNFDSYPGWTVNSRWRLGNTTTVDGKSTRMASCATGSLYNYTPHRPDSGWLTAGDGNHYYGNYNFIYFFTNWFGSTRASVLFKLDGNPTQYLEWGLHYYPVPNEDALKAYGLYGIAPRTVSSFPDGKSNDGILGRAAKFGSDNTADPDWTPVVNVVDNGRYHGVPNAATLAKHGYSTWNTYEPTLKTLLAQSNDLRPLVRKPNGAIYLMETGQRRVFPDSETYSTLSGPDYQNNTVTYSSQEYTNMSDAYLAIKPETKPMLLDGKFLKAIDNPTIYLHDQDKLWPFNAGSYASWGKPLDYGGFTQASLAPMASGGSAPVFIKNGTNNKFVVDLGLKKQFDGSTQTTWNKADGDFTILTDNTLNRLPSATARPLLKNGTTVYLIAGGARYPFTTSSDFTGSGYAWSQVDQTSSYTLSLIPAGGSPVYSPGSLIRHPDGAVYLVDKDFKRLAVPSLETFNRYGFDWSSVRSAGSNFLSDYTSNGALTYLLKNTANGAIYLMDRGQLHFVNSTLYGSTKYNFAAQSYNNVNYLLINALEFGQDLSDFIKGSGTTVYKVENGQKKPFSSQQSFYDNGGTWDKVLKVSDEFLNEIPTGSSY